MSDADHIARLEGELREVRAMLTEALDGADRALQGTRGLRRACEDIVAAEVAPAAQLRELARRGLALDVERAAQRRPVHPSDSV